MPVDQQAGNLPRSSPVLALVVFALVASCRAAPSERRSGGGAIAAATGAVRSVSSEATAVRSLATPPGLAPSGVPVPAGTQHPDQAARNGSEVARIGARYAWLDGECIAVLQLTVAYPLRYNTPDGQPPYGAEPETYEWGWGWMSAIPLRFDVENVIWGNCPYDGVVTYQLRQKQAYETPTPPPESRLGDPFARWWIREETMRNQPRGLAVINMNVEPPPLPSPDWDVPYREEQMDRYMFALAAELSAGGATYVSASVHDWYEYVDGTAVCLIPPRELPISDLLAEVHEGLRLMGRE